MGGLFQFIYRIRIFLFFLLLEAGCVYLTVVNNVYQSTLWLNSSNEAVAQVMRITDSVSDYFSLAKINENLADENARLNKLLLDQKRWREQQALDTLKHPLAKATDDSIPNKLVEQYSFQVAKVINNSVNRQNNYLTLNRGLADGIFPGMAVIAPQGVVGKVSACSQNFCTVTSILHRKMIVSVAIQKTNASGGLSWNGTNPQVCKLNYIARHLKPVKGDTIITSANSSVFPPGIMVGRIAKVSIKDNDTFYDIDVALNTEYSTLQFVYIINNRFKAERDSLERRTDPLMLQ
jgi:rod shape-determining protein MreC